MFGGIYPMFSDPRLLMQKTWILRHLMQFNKNLGVVVYAWFKINGRVGAWW